MGLGLGIGDHIEQCLGDGQVIALVPLFNARSPWLMPYTPTFSPAARFKAIESARKLEFWHVIEDHYLAKGWTLASPRGLEPLLPP